MQLATQVALWCSVAGAVVLGSVAAVGTAHAVHGRGEIVRGATVRELAMPTELLAPAVRAGAHEDPAPIVRADSLAYAFVFQVGKDSYVKLAGDADAIRHRAPTLIAGDGEAAAIAAVDPRRLPESTRMWLGHQVVVDGACTATIDGFAIVARLTGTTPYAGIDSGDGEHDAAWTAATAFDKGTRVLAARLSRCTGTWARDAALPGAVVGAEEPTTADIAARVKADLFASPLAREADAGWDDPQWSLDAADPAEKLPWRQRLDLTVKTYAHEQNARERWITVRGMIGGGCGERTVDLSAVYKLDATGALTRVWLGSGMTITNLVDVDGDGTFELVGAAGFVESRAVLMRADGTELDAVAVPFYGCPC